MDRKEAFCYSQADPDNYCFAFEATFTKYANFKNGQEKIAACTDSLSEAREHKRRLLNGF